MRFLKTFRRNLIVVNIINFILSTIIQRTCGYKNIALGKPTWQEYPFSSEPGKTDYKSENAVDGKKTDFSGEKCAVSQGRKNNATWRVDLGAILGIHHIRIYYRTGGISWDQRSGYASRFLGFSVYISNTTEKSDGKLCFKDTTFTKATIPAVITLNCTHHGRYVIYYNERKPTDPPSYSEYAHVELCEFEVYGCSSPEYFGDNCSQRCPSNCLDNRCHISGDCFQCEDGYQGNECEKPCQNNTYGRQCSKVCGKCRDGQHCDNTNGVCYMGCDAGYIGTTCQQKCPVGRFGVNCKSECSVNCGKPESCDRVTGHCVGGCQKGWTGRKCDKREQACKNNTYGHQCSKVCGKCRDGQQCDHTNGVCYIGCDAGYSGSTCHQECPVGTFGVNCKSKCSVNCGKPESCDRVTGQCVGDCQKGWAGHRCDKREQDSKEIANSSTLPTFAVYAIVTVLILSVLLNGVLIFWNLRNAICRQIYVTSHTKTSKDLSAIEDITKAATCKVECNEDYEELEQISQPIHYDQV